MKCTKCGGSRFRKGGEAMARKLDGRTFRGTLPATVCTKCGEVFVDGKEIARFDAEIAARMARDGAPSGASFQWMRKAMGLRGADLAPLLDVSAETLSRWETGERTVPRTAWVLLSRIVLEGRGPSSPTLGRLTSLTAHAPTLPKVVQLGASAKG